MSHQQSARQRSTRRAVENSERSEEFEGQRVGSSVERPMPRRDEGATGAAVGMI